MRTRRRWTATRDFAQPVLPYDWTRAELLREARDILATWLPAEEAHLVATPPTSPAYWRAQARWQEALRQYEVFEQRLAEST